MLMFLGLGDVQAEVLIIFMAIYALILFRKVGRFRIEIWMSMLVGALTLIVLGFTSLNAAFDAVNKDVILFLFGTFLIVEVMIQTGLLQYLAIRFLKTAQSPSRLLLIVIVFVGLASAFLVNDAVVVVMTAIVIASCSLAKVRKTPFILAVALASNIGSALTPIGNPQNVLIKIESGISTIGFMGKMALPVALGLLAEYYIIKAIYRKDINGKFELDMPAPSTALTQRRGAYAVGFVAIAVIAGFLTSDLTGWPIALTALAGGTFALALSTDRRKTIRGIDWGTLVFFASMFVVMDTVSRSGLLQYLIEPFSATLFATGSASVLSIFGLSLSLSQITSNVPFVAIMLPVFHMAGATSSQWLTLAAGSTLAGNLTLMGAAANIIVLEAAENRGETFSFMEFLKVGLPTALSTSAIAIPFLILLG